MYMDSIMENISNPSTVAIIGGTTIATNFVTTLPVLINVVVLVYFTMMVVHKGYQMWKEYKNDNRKSRK